MTANQDRHARPSGQGSRLIATVQEAANYLEVSKRSVLRWIKADAFPAPAHQIQTGPTVRRVWEVSALEDFKAVLTPSGRLDRYKLALLQQNK